MLPLYPIVAVFQFLCIGWSVRRGWLVGWSVDRSIDWSVSQSVGQLVGRSVGQLVSQLVVWLIGWPVGRSVGWLVGQAVKRLVIWSSVGRLVRNKGCRALGGFPPKGSTPKSSVSTTCAMHMHTPFTTSITIYILSTYRVDRGLRNSKCAPMRQSKLIKVVFLRTYKKNFVLV
jgi:hypothetical protein